MQTLLPKTKIGIMLSIFAKKIIHSSKEPVNLSMAQSVEEIVENKEKSSTNKQVNDQLSHRM